ncbi:coiled-coil domain-containing protein 174-like isoform X1 [Daphnia pulicaria]|uniref:coiled-coil domain-containing protein 174-like isoform X1 n=1 Tax=Daphnia pulicaria TaxID=35523 RepID=UPI001EEA8A3B|nr:coiled-coil domain-containing protein 174-like isoform X1 [Daphnia pulicaria]
MDSEIKKGPKKIEISSSSLVALKAELLNKQSQVQKVKTDGFKTIRNRPTKKVVLKQNSGVELRAKRDEEQIAEDQPTLDKSRLILEEKAKLYERLSRDKALLQEDTISEDQSVFLVDFQQKVVENTIKEKRAQSSKHSKTPRRESSSSDDEAAGEEEYATTNPEEEWVDYVDSFGRTRRCLKKDLTVFQKQDAELNKQPVASTTSVSYGNFVAASVQVSNEEPSILSLDEEARKRQRQLWEEEEEKNRDKSKVHYQDILYQEARQHGVGFYSFSKDEEERAKQMEELERIRKLTEAARAQTTQTSADKQSALEARLKKVRDRKRQKLGLPPLSIRKEHPKRLPTPPEPEAPPTTDSAKEAEDNLRKSAARGLPQSAKIRPWDFGKEGVPKKPVMTQSSWVEKKREERKEEFAPPSAFTESTDTSRPRKFAKHQDPIIKTEPVISEDSIISGLAFMKQMQFPSRSGVQPSPPDRYDGKDVVAEEEENDDDLMPPGETDEPHVAEPSSRWRSVPSRGAEIAPPSSMDYYNNSSARRGVSSHRTDVSQSFSVGINQRKNAGDDNSSPAKGTTRPKWDFSQ